MSCAYQGLYRVSGCSEITQYISTIPLSAYSFTAVSSVGVSPKLGRPAVTMKSISLALIPLLAALADAAPSAPGWRFDLKPVNSGITALESIVVSPNLVVFFDRASNNPLQVKNHSAWGALWNLQESTVTPLDLLTNSFCASGALISNGSMVSSALARILCFGDAF